MTTLEIFGICFIVEIAIIVIAIVVTIITNIIDKKQKENTYKHLLKYEQKLKNKKPIDNSNTDEKISQFSVLIPKGINKTSVKELLNLSDEELKNLKYKNANVVNYIAYYDDGTKLISSTVDCTSKELGKGVVDNNGKCIISDTLECVYNLSEGEPKPYFVSQTYLPKIEFDTTNGDINIEHNKMVDIQLIIDCEPSVNNEVTEDNDVKIDQENLNELLKSAIQK